VAELESNPTQFVMGVPNAVAEDEEFAKVDGSIFINNDFWCSG
jgi:hypothetical protein